MRAHKVAEDIWRIPLLGPDLLNVYIAGGVLIDSGVRFLQRRLLAFLDDRTLSSHVLTHAHPDHQGCSHGVCERFGVPLFCGEGERRAQESGRFEELMPRPGVVPAPLTRFLSGPAHPVLRALGEGDEVGGLTVVETPGHTPGHLSFWDEKEKVLILGDVLFHRNPVTFRLGLEEPFRSVTFHRAANLASARKLAGLKPRMVCFGHGPPLHDGDRFCRFVESLPRA